jgi:hypothetical protein
MLDGRLIALDGASLRFLVSPVQAVHQPPDMRAVIVHPKLPLDHLGDARRGPQVGPVAVRRRSLEEQLHQPAPLGGSQLGRAARGAPTRNAFQPPRRQALNHRITELAAQWMRRPTSLRDKPVFSKAKARRRRSSSRSALPFGLRIGADFPQHLLLH